MAKTENAATLLNNYIRFISTKEKRENMAFLALLGRIERPLCTEFAKYIHRKCNYYYPMLDTCCVPEHHSAKDGEIRRRLIDIVVVRESTNEVVCLFEAKYITNIHGDTSYRASDEICTSLKSLRNQLRSVRGWKIAGKNSGAVKLGNIPIIGILFSCFKSDSPKTHDNEFRSWKQKYTLPYINEYKMAYYPPVPETFIFQNEGIRYAGNDWCVSLEMTALTQQVKTVRG